MPVARAIPLTAGRNFGLALVLLGNGLLVMGIWYHVRFMRQVRAERTQMIQEGLVPHDDRYPVSLTLIGATMLLIIGLIAVFSMVTRVTTVP